MLNDTMRNIYEKFLFEHPNIPLKYTLFTKLRPFWVVPPSEADRDTCLCEKHDNVFFLAKALKQLGVLESSNTERMACSLACDQDSMDCMYGRRNNCKDREVPVLEHSHDDQVTDVVYNKWILKKQTPVPPSWRKPRLQGSLRVF